MQLLALIWNYRCVWLHDFKKTFATTWLWIFSSLRTGCREVNSRDRKANVNDECALCYEEIFIQSGKHFPRPILELSLSSMELLVGSWSFGVKYFPMFGKVLVHAWSWSGRFNQKKLITIGSLTVKLIFCMSRGNIKSLGVSELILNDHSNLPTDSKHAFRSHQTWKVLYENNQLLTQTLIQSKNSSIKCI